MATTTAMILIGEGHPNDGGINVRHQIDLLENDHPLLVLRDAANQRELARWIPTIQGMTEDCLVMIAAILLGDQEITDLLAKHLSTKTIKAINLNDYQDLLPLIYQAARKAFLNRDLKIVITLLDGNSMESSIDSLNYYQMDLEICPSVFSRYHSSWTGKIETKGRLESIREW